MEGTTPRGEDVALFIDWENFKISLATGSRTPNVTALKEEVSNYGRVVVAKAYADWVTRSPELKGASQFILDPPALYATGIEPVYVPTRLPSASYSSQYTRMVRVKNSVDVKMTADCIECAHSYPNIGTFVLVSGDSDFIHVVNALRTMGKRVLIVGVSWATSRRLADQVDGLILYDTDVDPLTPVEQVPAPAPIPVQAPPPALAPAPAGNGRALGAGTGELTRRELPEVIRAIEEIVRAERLAGRTPLLTSIKQRLTRRYPNFDEKKVGFSGFKKLILRAAQEGNIKLVTAGLVDWVLMADEPSPAEVAAEAAADVAVPAGVVAEAEGRTEESELEPKLEAELEPEFAPAALEPVSATPAPALRTPDPDIASAGLTVPKGPDDGLDAGRVADLIVMADTLEHREAVNHVAFNFLVSEVCGALAEGLKVEHPEIVQRWGQAHSQTYVTKLLRSLTNAEMFKHGWHTLRDETTGQARRRRTINLNREHALVHKILEARWGLAPAPTEAPPPSARAPIPLQEDQWTPDEEQIPALAGAEE